MKVGIIGCGLIGQKRAAHLPPQAQVVACADINPVMAEKLAAKVPDCKIYPQWQDLASDKNIDVIIIATPHQALVEVALAAIAHKKHLLIEKPAARHYQELEPVSEAAKKQQVLVRVGFNHRYHRAFQKAREIVDSGTLGDLMFVRARYGHGGRIGYDQEWRAKPHLSGGGELIDQGVHLIDLARWFLGDFEKVEGFATTYFWQMPVDDNGFMMLRTPKKQVAFLHASCTEWKNTFSFEIYGQVGKLEINGLGGSYGIEKLHYYKMLPEMGPPETTIYEYPMADNSWQVELAEFFEDIRLRRQPSVNLWDALQTLRIVDEVYQQSGLDFKENL